MIYEDLSIHAPTLKEPGILKISENLSITKPPSDKEIDFIRSFAPGAAMGRALATEVTFLKIAEDLQKRGKSLE